MLWPVATWKIKDVPNELDDPDKGIGGRLFKVQTGFSTEIQEQRDKLKRNC